MLWLRVADRANHTGWGWSGKQVPPLRCGMTSKKATTKAKCRFLRQAQDGLFDRAVRKLLELPFDSAQGQDDTIFWWVGFVLTVTATATAKAKCGGLST